LALVDLPDEAGIDHPLAHQMFPPDAIRRARLIKQTALDGHGSGAYSHSKGVKMFREDVCSFLQQRDGSEVPTGPENIFLTNGASAAITQVLQALIADSTWYVVVLVVRTYNYFLIF
jgi:aspartate/methionine/tyrosine aminotransferase